MTREKTEPCKVREEITEYFKNSGLLDMGFFIDDVDKSGLTYGISIVSSLSDAVVDEILWDTKPTHSYFHHYRTTNAFLDRCMLDIGHILEKNGYLYVPIGASQSIRTEEDMMGFHGRYSYKKGACLAALGVMGTNGLFLHKEHGPRVRLGTILTDCELIDENPPLLVNTTCEHCGLCAKSCPAGAIYGRVYEVGMPEFMLVDPQKCSTFMKDKFKMMGRGAVCGICMAVCPAGRRK